MKIRIVIVRSVLNIRILSFKIFPVDNDRLRAFDTNVSMHVGFVNI